MLFLSSKILLFSNEFPFSFKISSKKPINFIHCKVHGSVSFIWFECTKRRQFRVPPTFNSLKIEIYRPDCIVAVGIECYWYSIGFVLFPPSVRNAMCFCFVACCCCLFCFSSCVQCAFIQLWSQFICLYFAWCALRSVASAHNGRECEKKKTVEGQLLSNYYAANGAQYSIDPAYTLFVRLFSRRMNRNTNQCVFFEVLLCDTHTHASPRCDVNPFNNFYFFTYKCDKQKMLSSPGAVTSFDFYWIRIGGKYREWNRFVLHLSVWKKYRKNYDRREKYVKNYDRNEQIPNHLFRKKCGNKFETFFFPEEIYWTRSDSTSKKIVAKMIINFILISKEVKILSLMTMEFLVKIDKNANFSPQILGNNINKDSYDGSCTHVRESEREMIEWCN